MLHVPLTLLLHCFLIIGASQAQQCRLVAPKALLNGGTPTSPSSSSAASASTGSAAAPATPSITPFSYGKTPIRGVNLGGWFVLEPWITPSIFENTGNSDIIDEYTFGQMQDTNTALGVLTNHWDTWITEDDFDAIAAAGLNHVRVPLGYWSVPLPSGKGNSTVNVSPYIPGAWTYLLRALNWAKSRGIHVILDLHGAPGSQNGFDNSGQRIANPLWAGNQTNVNRTLDVIQFIAENIGGMIDVLELLNEPAGFESSSFAQTVRDYWSDGYNVVRDAVGGGLKIMIGDAFLGVASWTDFLTYPGAQGVLMDYHEYQIFSVPELQRSLDDHISFACTLQPNLTSFAASNIWTVVGEWSTAPTDCAKWLNGLGVGARWDGTYWNQNAALGSCDGWTGNMSNFSSSYKTFLRKYWEVQTEIGEAVSGWVYWTWKAENADEWSYSKGLEGGWIPQDPTDRMYPNLCS
ncbi:glycoside hydrolase family 5 protein [Plicaturopsis crispa FD-325 SS-3]|nr:glycoside hydrolase family 5 protein [Plicaturopsis crispa FD-325 SS-3]